MLCTLLPWIIGLGSALIGGFIGWYLFRNRKWLPYQNTIDEQTAAYDTLNTSYNTLNSRYTTTQANLLELQNSHLQWESRYHTLNNDHLALASAKRSLATDFDAYKAEVEKTEAALQTHLIEMDALVKQRTADWETKLAQSNEQLAASEAKLKAQSLKFYEIDVHFDDLQQKHDALLEDSKGYISEITNLKNAVEDLTTDVNFEKQRVAALEASDKESQSIIQGLESHVNDLTTQHATLQVAHSDLNNLVTALNTAHASEKQSWESQLTTLTNSHAAVVAEHEAKTAELSALKVENEELVAHHSTLTTQLGDLERQHSEAQAQVQQFDASHDQKLGEISVMRYEIEKLTSDNTALNAQLSEWEHKYYDVQLLNDKLQNDLIAHHKTAEHLHETRVHLHALQEELATSKKELALSHAKLESHTAQLEAWETEKKEYESQVETLMEDIQNYHTKTADHLHSTRARLHESDKLADDLKAQNEKLQHDLAAHERTAEHLHETRTHLHELKDQFAQSSEAWEAEKKEYETHVEKLIEEIQNYHTKTAEHLHNTRARLHESQTRVSNYELLVADLEAELARLREGGKTLVIETPVETVVNVQDPDKLEIVEGIGPKIAALLNAAGIYTFLQLSEASFETLKLILDDAGPRFRMHDPHTWPAQAAMAHKGDWDELKVYQEHLKGGRDNG